VEDFRHTLRRLREQRRWSQNHLARVSGVDNSHLARVERGERDCSADMAQWLDTALEADGEIVEAHRVTVERNEPRDNVRRTTRSYDREASMRRRHLLQQAIVALATGTTAALPALDVIRGGLVSSVTGQDEAGSLDVTEWEEVGWEYGHAYFTQRSDNLVQNLAADLADLQCVLDPLPVDDPQRLDLSRVSAQLAAIMAMSLTNLGQFQPARRWWHAARRAADASTDAAIRVWVRGHDATHALYDHRPLDAALLRADEAIAISAESAYAGTGEAVAAKGQALALLGRADEARDTISMLPAIFEQLPPAAAADQHTIYGWPEQRLWHGASYVYTHLGTREKGDSQLAAEAQKNALHLYATASPRSRAQIQLHTATCLVRDGHIDEGANHAQTTLEALPHTHRTAMVLGVAAKVLEAVPSGEHRRPPVRALEELISAPARQVTA
jgi:transcriptional regulator with XRE-family HTH domain